MAESSWPYDSGPGSDTREDRWRDMARHWVAGGDGVLAGELDGLLCFADSTGLQVKLKAGRAWLRGAHYLRDAEAVMPIAANASGSTRIDRVVLRNDFTANSTTAIVITGTPGSGAPALVRTASVWDIPLAQVSIPAGDATIDAGQVTDERPLVGPWIGMVSVPSATVRDLMIPSPAPGSQVSRRDVAGVPRDLWDGAAWRLTPCVRSGLEARRVTSINLAANSLAAVTLPTEDRDTFGNFTAGGSLWTCSQPGLYTVSALFEFSTMSTSYVGYLKLTQGGVLRIPVFSKDSLCGATTVREQFAPGDTVEMILQTNVTGTFALATASLRVLWEGA